MSRFSKETVTRGFLLIGLVGIGAFFFLSPRTDAATNLPLLLVVSIIGLVMSLAFAAIVLKDNGLADPSQALALPQGSVRSLIALGLILIFIISAIHLFGQVQIRTVSSKNITQSDLNIIERNSNIVSIERLAEQEGQDPHFNVETTVGQDDRSHDLAQQILTTTSTVLVAVVGFYFGSRAVESGIVQSSEGVTRITAVKNPEGKQEGKKGSPDWLYRLEGEALNSPREVKLKHAKGQGEIQGKIEATGPTLVLCKFDLSNATPDDYYLIVVKADGTPVVWDQLFRVVA